MTNLSLCGCGFLGIYHLGVARCLRDHGQKLMSRVQCVAGASAGSLIGCVLVCDPSKIEVCVDFTLKLAKDIRKKPLGALTPGYHLLDPLKQFLTKNLPSDAYLRCTDRLFISVTNSRTKKNEVKSKFASNEELLLCLMASSHIPVYCGVKPVSVGTEKYIDGGITKNLIIFEEGHTVTISPFCGPQDICPKDKIGKGWFFNAGDQHYQLNKKNLVRGLHALFPPSQKILKLYFKKGFNDAAGFLKAQGLYEGDDEIIENIEEMLLRASNSDDEKNRNSLKVKQLDVNENSRVMTGDDPKGDYEKNHRGEILFKTIEKNGKMETPI